MKITKRTLRHIIAEELKEAAQESPDLGYDPIADVFGVPQGDAEDFAAAERLRKGSTELPSGQETMSYEEIEDRMRAQAEDLGIDPEVYMARLRKKMGGLNSAGRRIPWRAWDPDSPKRAVDSPQIKESLMKLTSQRLKDLIKEELEKREMPSAETDEEIINAWKYDASNLGLDPDLHEIISSLDDQQILMINNYWESQTGQRIPILDPVTQAVPAGDPTHGYDPGDVAPFPFSRDYGRTMDPHQVKVIKKALKMVGVPSASGLAPMDPPPMRESYEEDDYSDAAGDKFVPDMHAASRGGDLGGPAGAVGMADDTHAKRIINSELMNIKSALRAGDIAAARASLKKVNVFMDTIGKDDFPGFRMSESVRRVPKSTLYRIIKEELQNVMEQRPSMPNIPDDAYDFPDDSDYRAAGGEAATPEEAAAYEKKRGRQSSERQKAAEREMDQAKPGDEGYNQSTQGNWKANAYMQAGNGREAFEAALAPAKPEVKAALLKAFDAKNFKAIKKWALGQ